MTGIHRVAAAFLAALMAAGPGTARGQEAGPTRARVTLVLLDTVVTDRKGNHAAGLTAADFDLLVDGRRAPIHSLEERCAPGAAAPPAGGATGAVAEGEPRHFIILFDLSHMLAGSRRDAIRASVRFAEEAMRPSDRVMVLAALRGLRIVTRFTSDRGALRDRLLALLDDASMVDSSAFEEQNDLERLVREYGLSTSRNAFPGTRGSGGSRRVSRPSGTPEQCLNESRIAEFETARTLRLLASAMPAFASLPGRKAMILFTETLRSDPGRPFADVCGVPTLRRDSLGLTVVPEMQDLTLKANLAGVSIYPVHAGGMGGGVPGLVRQAARDFQVDLALSTGGRDFILMGRPIEAFQQAERDGSCHYVVAYQPPEGAAGGRHTVTIRPLPKGLKARHRESFSLRSPEEASEDQMLAVLTDPGLYRELPVAFKAHGLGQDERGRRRYLLRASVPVEPLTLLRSSGGQVSGSVQIRGILLTGRGPSCEFSREVGVESSAGQDEPPSRVGLEAMCDLEPGAHEIVVAARDVNGGGLGAFWGRIEARPASRHAGPQALLWAPASGQRWARCEDCPAPGGSELVLREDWRIGREESAALTFLACRSKATEANVVPRPASVLLEGAINLDVPAVATADIGGGPCRTMRADVPAASLAPGRYRITPRLPPDWAPAGAPVVMEVVD